MIRRNINRKLRRENVFIFDKTKEEMKNYLKNNFVMIVRKNFLSIATKCFGESDLYYLKKLIKEANIKKFIIASDILIADKTLEQIYEGDLNEW